MTVRYNMVDGVRMEMSPEETRARVEEERIAFEKQKANQYKYERSAAYGNLFDQLDMIYWDKVNGTSIWIEHCSKVKSQYPKP